MQYPLLFRRPFPRPLVFLGFPASKAAEMVPQKHQNCRFCNTRSFSEGHFQGPLYFLDFLLPRLPKWEEHHKSTKIVDFAIPALFRRPFPRPLVFFRFPASKAAEMGVTPQKHQNRGHFQGRSYFLDFQLPRPPKWGAFRRPFPTPLGLPGFPASKATEMGGTPQKHQNCRFGNTRSFSGGHLQGPLYFLDFRLPRRPKWGLTPQKHKHCRFCNICLVFLGFSGFQGRRNGREPHKSTKIDDFAIPAPFPVVFLGFLASRAVEMEGTPQKPEAISKALSISCISGFQGHRNGGKPKLTWWKWCTNIVDFAILAPFPAAIPRPLAFL